MTEPESVYRIYPELKGATILRYESLHIHEQDGKRLVMSGETFQEIPDTRNKYFSRGQMHDYYESVREFLESESGMCIIPLMCIARKTKGRRYFVELLDIGNETFKIYNVEMIAGNWVNNEHNPRNIRSPKQGIEICKAGQPYTFMVVKEPESVFGFRVKGVKQ